MNITRFLIPFAVVMASIGSPIAAPSGSSGARVEVVKVRNYLVVRQRIVAGESQLVVPTCDVSDDERRSLCILAVVIEVESDQGWVRAPLNREIGSVPGGYPIEQGPVTIIAPGTAADFTFTINKPSYVFSRGQQIRLRIHAWPTEESMRAKGPWQELITSPFQAW